MFFILFVIVLCLSGKSYQACNSQTFNLDDPTFPDDATINSVTINGRLSYASATTKIYEISLVIDYTEAVSTTLTKLTSGNLKITSGKLTIK